MSQFNVEDEILRKFADIVAKDIDSEILHDFQKEIEKMKMPKKDSKLDVDTRYLHQVKFKIELLLVAIIQKYSLENYLSDKFRFRLDMNRYYQSEHYSLYEQKKDINGNNLRYGHDYVPTDIEDWIKTFLPDYFFVSNVYDTLCSNRRIMQDDLKKLNKIAKRYKIESNESE